MRRLYVLPKENFHELADRGLFHPLTGGHYIDLPNGMVLASADFLGEYHEETFESHPDVAPLPHPVFAGNVTLQAHAANPDRKFQKAHLDALAAIGVDGSHTVMDVSRKAAAIHPLVKVKHTY